MIVTIWEIQEMNKFVFCKNKTIQRVHDEYYVRSILCIINKYRISFIALYRKMDFS